MSRATLYRITKIQTAYTRNEIGIKVALYVCIHAYSFLVFTKEENLSMNYEDLETLVIEIENAKEKNLIWNLVYRLPNGLVKKFHEYLKLVLDRTIISHKNIVLIGEFNLNLLDFYHNLMNILHNFT